MACTVLQMRFMRPGMGMNAIGHGILYHPDESHAMERGINATLGRFLPIPRRINGRPRFAVASDGTIDCALGFNDAMRSVIVATLGLPESTRGVIVATLGLPDSTRGVIVATFGIRESTRGISDTMNGENLATRGFTESTPGTDHSMHDLGDSTRGTYYAAVTALKSSSAPPASPIRPDAPDVRLKIRSLREKSVRRAGGGKR